ncbi:hypothetical protein AGLY_009493 [Aphis glycines]|uniref:Uncharacterized protein n=1 Tax=Aphis glycines TaxID=307491 RepID=A0A6G0TI01_APHGL|nr:hypothetical protein AGLY_009493 [Aphis glycines]
MSNINKSSLYRKDDFNKESTVNGIRSRFSPSNLYKLPLNDGIIPFQSINLRLITKAPWYVSNHTLHNDLNICTLPTLARIYYSNFHAHTHNHPNPLISNLSSKTIPNNPPHRLKQDNNAPGSVENSQASVPPSAVFNAVSFPSKIIKNYEHYLHYLLTVYLYHDFQGKLVYHRGQTQLEHQKLLALLLINT